MGVTTSWKWEDANRVIEHEPRSKCFKSLSEKKHVFNDFIHEMRTRERNDARLRRQTVS